MTAVRPPSLAAQVRCLFDFGNCKLWPRELAAFCSRSAVHLVGGACMMVPPMEADRIVIRQIVAKAATDVSDRQDDNRNR